MVSIVGALERIKRQPLEVPGVLDAQAVEQVFQACGHVWRERMLGPAPTLELFIQQVMQGNVPCAQVRHLAGGAFVTSAYCQARSRLPVKALWGLCRLAAEQLQSSHQAPADQQGLWLGRHRTVLLDGTSFSMPDTPELRECFGQSGMQQEGCGFPVAHLLATFDAASGMVLGAEPAPLRTHDLRNVLGAHEHLRQGDVAVGDCAFGSWAHLALLQSRGSHGLFPLHQRRKLKTLKNGGVGGRRPFDRVETWPKPLNPPSWMTAPQYAMLPEQIQVRVLRRTVHRKGLPPLRVTLVTTLLDRTAYPAEELLKLGRSRWTVEINLRHLKTTMGLEVLRCKTVEGVLKELAVFLLVYNLVRAVMLKAAARQDVDVDRVSFADALGWVRHTRPGAELWDLIVNPLRPDRVEPRAIKRRPKQYHLLNKPREQLRKALRQQKVQLN